MAKLNITVQSLMCNQETPAEIDADEPYLLITVVYLPEFDYEVVRYGSWADVNTGERRTTFERPSGWTDAMWQSFGGMKVLRTRFWNEPKEISAPNDVIIIVSLVEHDGGNMDVARTTVTGAVAASLGGSMTASRDERVTRLITDIRGALQAPSSLALNLDDPIRTRELVLSQDDVSSSAGSMRTKDLQLNGIGARYTARFQFDYS